MTRWARWLVTLGVLSGCAGRGPATHEPTGAARPPSAARIYTVGEEQFAAGHYHEAVELWRHAVLALPAEPDFDDLRHQLVLRLAYGQLMAWQHSQNPGYLEDAQGMLLRYAERHQAIFGNDDDAQQQRGEIYEMLHQVEVQLDPPPPEDEDDDDDDEDPSAVENPLLALVASIAEIADDPEPVDEDYVEDGEFERTIVVTRERTDADDPQLRALMNSRFTDPFFLGGVLTGPEIALVHGPRPLLRAGGSARPADDQRTTAEQRREARQLGRALLTNARPALKTCYEAAFARQPQLVARSTVEVDLDAEGRVSDASIVEGGLVDTMGDLCLVEHLEATQVERTADAGQARIRLPLTFFYEGPVLFNEANGRSAPAGVIQAVEAEPGTPRRGRDGSAVRGGAVGA